MPKTFEQELRCNIILLEGIAALGIKPFYNRDYCPHREKCLIYELVEKHWKYNKPRPCLLNPKIATCLIYQYYRMPLLLSEKNPE